MIIPKRDAKSYGAVHIDYFLTFVGFCKKVSSDEIQSIDVFIDGNKIDTIVCDKTIDKVSQIYDIEGHGFEYDLPEVYFDKRHLLSFRCSDSGEELVNSPISTICKNDEKFNEYKFLNSLSKPIDEDKVKDVYCPNSIGFLATEKNLNDTDFMNYIKELVIKFDHIQFKGFAFDTKNIKDYFNAPNISIETVSQIEDILINCSIFISNRYSNYSKSVLLIEKSVVNYNCNLIIFDKRIINATLTSVDKMINISQYDPYRDDYLKLGLKKYYNNSSITTVYEEVFLINSSKLNFDNMTTKNYYDEIIKNILKSNRVKDILQKAAVLYYHNNLKDI